MNIERSWKTRLAWAVLFAASGALVPALVAHSKADPKEGRLEPAQMKTLENITGELLIFGGTICKPGICGGGGVKPTGFPPTPPTPPLTKAQKQQVAVGVAMTLGYTGVTTQDVAEALQLLTPIKK